MNTLQDALISKLKQYITDSRVAVIEDDGPLFESMKHFYPVTRSGIDWNKVPMHVHIPAVGTASHEDRVAVLRNALGQFGSASRLTSAGMCLIFGDNVTEKAFRMEYPLFMSLSPLFFEMPQVTYVVSEDMAWCFEVAYDDHVFFGRSPFTETRKP